MNSIIRQELSSYWKVYAAAAAASLMSGACGASLLAVMNSAVSNRAGWTTIGVFLVLVIGKVLGHCLARGLLSRLAQRSVLALRGDLCRRIVDTPLRRLEQAGSMRLLGALVEDVVAIRAALEAIPICINNMLLLIGCVVYLGWLSPAMLPPLAGVVILGLAGYAALRRRAFRSSRDGRENESQLMTLLRGVAEGGKELQLNRSLRRSFLDEDVRSCAEHVRRQGVRTDDAFILIDSWTHFLFYSMVGVLIFALPEWRAVSRTVLVGYLLAVLFMMRPIVSVLQLLPLLNRGRVAHAHIEDLKLGLGAGASAIAALSPECPSCAQVELVGVGYSHPGGDHLFRLGPLDFSLSPGELVFVVGGNGSGKSTLAKVVAGLYAPDFGEVRLNGVPVRDAQRDDYRQLFGAVFVDSYLFHRLPDHCNPQRLAQAHKYLAEFRIAHKVRIEDGVFRSAGLSQGEQKRLALVTAYLEDRPFYIFDEWAANQDPLFKETFYLRLLPDLTARGKAVLAISHDDRYFTAAHTVVRMDEGRIVSRERLSSQAS
ncbi:MAG: cyclic peptide export ABC transporter [Isosphaeraceae bacterium]|nr:cyclic peptide export ABC transporter [Isosphaeraceae bacterium]